MLREAAQLKARRQLGLSYANLGLARIRADRNAEGRQYLEAAHKIAVDTRDAFLERMIRANANNNPEIGLRVDDLPGGRAADPRSPFTPSRTSTTESESGESAPRALDLLASPGLSTANEIPSGAFTVIEWL